MKYRPFATPIDETTANQMLAPFPLPQQAPMMPAMSPVQARSRMDNSLNANKAAMFAGLKASGMDDRQARAQAYAQGKMNEANLGDQTFGTGTPGGFFMQQGLATNADSRANMLAGGQNAYMRGLGEQASAQGYNARRQADTIFPAQAGLMGAQARNFDAQSQYQVPAMAGYYQSLSGVGQAQARNIDEDTNLMGPRMQMGGLMAEAEARRRNSMLQMNAMAMEADMNIRNAFAKQMQAQSKLPAEKQVLPETYPAPMRPMDIPDEPYPGLVGTGAVTRGKQRFSY